ncbi:hypothetical protein B0T20DRAFT_268028 [Sordaria brevicollis]|uniref:Uncharacterized protein n=1 Tax=Sordaria brevicollis TaxID=83679 RepID=A0AAE0PAK5_SORBR|nr:hypothetical protein B0T20DRAFT_268028 [Sordaria brevicollis]
MCIQEYIAYQCGHRTPGVVRPCPLTTAGHNFPVCTIQPSKQHIAQTMCGPCERLLHSRWVLIREWEHRWLHERGVCGCDVVFPGLLTRPRMIGNVSGSEEEEDIAERGTRRDTTGHYHGSTPSSTILRGDTAHTEEQAHQQGQGRTGGTGTAHHNIPPLFTETTVAGGNEQRVAIRLPGLYAAEWLADHRALHRSGGCQCPAQFTPFQPEVGEHDMSAEEREFLEKYRQTENRNRAISESEEEIVLRMAQINDAFGPFDPAAANTVATLPVDKPAFAVADLPPTGPRRARAHSHRCQRQRQSHDAHHQQVHHHQGQVGHHHSQQGYATPSTSAINTIVPPFPQGQSLDPTPAQYYQPQQPACGLVDHMAHLSISTTQGRGNANPSYHAAPSNYGIYEQYVYGPHTFVPMGITFPEHNPEETQEDKQHQHKQEGQLRSLTTPPIMPFPFSGLPIGSGPEGSEVHMPEWEKCLLRRCKSSFQPGSSGAGAGMLPETDSTVGVESNTTAEDENGDEDNHESFVGHTEQGSYQVSSLGEGYQHQRSSSYS